MPCSLYGADKAKTNFPSADYTAHLQLGAAAAAQPSAESEPAASSAPAPASASLQVLISSSL